MGRQKSILHSIIIIQCINFGWKSKIKNFFNTEIYFLNMYLTVFDFRSYEMFKVYSMEK